MINSADIKRLKKDALCEIYSGDDLSHFNVGRFMFECDGFVYFCSYNKYGEYDGIMAFEASSVVSVKENTKYLKCIEKMIEPQNEEAEILLFSDYKLYSVLTEIKNNGLVCELGLDFLGDGCNNGYIDEVNEGAACIKVKYLNEYGEFDGEEIISVSSIVYFAVGTKDARKLQTLNKG